MNGGYTQFGDRVCAISAGSPKQPDHASRKFLGILRDKLGRIRQDWRTELRAVFYGH